MKRAFILLETTAITMLTSAFTFYSGKVGEIERFESNLTPNKAENILTATEDEIKILQLTDVQFQNYLNGNLVFNSVKKMIEKTTPDMVVFTGDNMGNKGKEEHLSAFVRFMDEFELPWAVVMGNHDYTSQTPMDVQCALYENSEYCLFQKGSIVESNGNYYYNVVWENRAPYSLIFMDSQEDGFTKEHVAWYEQTVQTLQAQNSGEPVSSFLFYHIPTVETEYAWELYQKDSSIGSGTLRERVDKQTTDVGFFDKVLELGSTKAIFYGHDHVNNAFISYRGIELCYGLKTGRNSYYRADMQGGNLITLFDDGNFNVKRVSL